MLIEDLFEALWKLWDVFFQTNTTQSKLQVIPQLQMIW